MGAEEKKIIQKAGRSGKKLIVAAIMAVAAFGLQCAARGTPSFGTWYAETMYPIFVGTMGRITGVIPVSVVELGIYGSVIGGVLYIYLHFRETFRLFCSAVLLLSALFLLFTLNCGINYYRRPFSSYLDLEVKASSKEELFDLCSALTDRVNELRLQTDGTGAVMMLNKEGVSAMHQLGDQYPQLSGFYPRPKPVLWSYLLSVQQLCGVYSPFTIEANYNKVMPAYNIPHTICHELSHLKGFMREDEANFIGYLACISSDQLEFQYSGYLTGWVYATNALAKVDMEEYMSLFGDLDPLVLQDLRQNNEFWDRYNGRTAQVANTLNDTYLKMNAQTDGVQSYGRVVDLMLAYARQARS